MDRRRFLSSGVATLAAGVVTTGCLDGDGDDGEDGEDQGPPDEVEVTAGPDGAWRFEPEEVEVAVGGTVEWFFASSGHNVTSHPDADNKCENPDGAEPFTSYDGDDHFAVSEPDSTFSHTFETPGEYVYVCTPHATQMVGTVNVVED
ncbi:MAG: plastocyanin/azurin family copper-binding protein [Halobacteriota archaeon]